MRQNLGQLIDGCMTRIANANVIQESGYIEEINHAIEELVSRIRDQRGEWLERQDFLDVTADKDEFTLPEDCGFVTLLERSYGGGVEGLGYRVLQRVQKHEIEQWAEARQVNWNAPDCYSYIPNRKLVIRPKPTESVTKGLRVTYSARFLPLFNLEDYPDVPDELHEWIIVGALDRLRQYPDAMITKADEFEMFRQEQNQRLTRFLAPTHLDQPSRIGDEDQFFLSY